ncbi:MAG: type II secretion system F family protein [Candidatus Nanopelagicales bacterium]
MTDLLTSLMSRRSSNSSIDLRLARAGRPIGPAQFRLEQSIAAGVGASIGIVMGLLSLASGQSPMLMIVLLLLGAVTGVLLSDKYLSTQVNRRQRRIAQQLPLIAELLAFAVAAGESPVVALRRVAQATGGDLADEFQLTLTDIRAGSPLDAALRDVAVRTGSPGVERFVDALTLALERGSPLADVLRAQAADARAADRRALLEIAGRKEVAMLVPVVFLILPTVVLIAIFPGVRGLQLIVP